MKTLPARILVTIFVLTEAGCASYQSISVEERQKITAEQKIYKVETTSGEFIEFDSDPLGYAILHPDGIARFMEDGSVRTIPFSSVRTIYLKKTSVASTAGGVIVIASVAAVTLLLLIGHGLSVSHF